jgi:peptidoglycan/LPS O-acetylase OafA/YrhL
MRRKARLGFLDGQLFVVIGGHLNDMRGPAKTINGFNSIRFICAFWVVMGHFGKFPLMVGVDKSNPLVWLINGVYNNLFSDEAAVIVFFVVSGFFIHYPQAQSLRIKSLLEYGARRYIRIGVPLVAAWAYGVVIWKMGLPGIVWSLWAELVYYSIYPLLLVLRRAGVCWPHMIGVALVASLMVAASDPGAGDYPSYGTFNPILGLPCWLIGCYAAESIRITSPTNHIWVWRGAVFGAAALCSMLRFHSSIGHPWTLNIFAFLVGLWLVREYWYFQSHEPPRPLERAGLWSYSIYLFHVQGYWIYWKVVYVLGLLNLGYNPNWPILNWSIMMSVILVTCWLFGRIIELPSHEFARWVGGRLSRSTPAAKPDIPLESWPRLPASNLASD